MVEKSINQNTPEITLGLCDTPMNSLLTSAAFTPSKIGGFPANMSPLPAQAQKCEKCGIHLTFVGQLYANVDQIVEFHRMIYIFACLSQECINT